MTAPPSPHRHGVRRWSRIVGVVALSAGVLPATAASAQQPEPTEPPSRASLGAGLSHEEAEWYAHSEPGVDLQFVANASRPEVFGGDTDLGSAVYNSDIAFQGDYAFLGNYAGYTVYDVSDPSEPELINTTVCPSSQGDISVYGDLLFLSSEGKRTSEACDSDPAGSSGWSGLRIFDISDIRNPEYVAAVSTCRGSHTHTVAEHPTDDRYVYVYVQGNAGVRTGDGPWTEGCVVGPSGNNPDSFLDEDGNPVPTSRFAIEIIKVPIQVPELAYLVDSPHVFADPETGNPHGLWPGGNHGEGTQSTSATNHCHDLTTYSEFDLLAGACSGNGILWDISDPEDPIRLDVVDDPNFSYWHGATFNNDGTKVLFIDEWGGGGGPRCREGDRDEWGATAIFDIVRDQDGENPRLELASYYKIPNEFSTGIASGNGPTVNCVSHNGSLIPVPGRDVIVQAWYQGGISVWEFTDSQNPVELAWFNRGPLLADANSVGGHWSTYYYNGYIYSNEITRGLDVLRIDGEGGFDDANRVRFDEFNAQDQPHVTWPWLEAPELPDDLQTLPRGEAAPAEVAAGEAAEVVLTGDGFTPGEFVEIWDLSGDEPESVGTEEADEDGIVTFVVAVASDAQLGTWSYVLEGDTSGRQVLVAFDVVEPDDDGTDDGDDDGADDGDDDGTDDGDDDDGDDDGTDDGDDDGTDVPARNPFRDVPGDSLHRDAIVTLAAQGIIQGKTADTFDPAGSLTRGQLASLVARASGIDTDAVSTTPYTDVTGSPHEGSIGALSQAGVIRGYTDGTFRPSQPVRRDQVATIVAGWLQLDTSVSTAFSDVPSDSVHAGAIAALADVGVLRGYDAQRFGPGDLVRRDQAASILWRALNLGSG